MSLFNAVIERDRAIVCVDTRGQLRGGPKSGSFVETTKIHALPHASAVLAGRGTSDVTNHVYFALANAGGANFDEMLETLPSLLQEVLVSVTRKAREAGSGLPAGYDIGLQEIYLVGWSDKRQAMVGSAYFRDPCAKKWEPALDMERSWATPWAEAWGPLPEPRAVSDLLPLAADQVRRLRAAEGPDAVIGGRLLVAELTREATTIRAICSFA